MTTDACLAAGAVIQQRLTDDKAVGIEIQLPTKLDSYVVGQGRIGVVVASDIFGWKSPQLRSNCDALAEAGFAVVMPDFFRGNTVPRLADGSLDGAKMFDFMETHGNWSHSVKKDTDTAVAFLYALKVERFAFLGFCWGGKQSMHVLSDPESQRVFHRVAGIHAALKDQDWALRCASKALHPLLLIQGNNDADPTPIADSLKQNATLSGTKCIISQYSDVAHGFAGTRGNRADPLILSRVKETISRIVDFFLQ